MSVAEAAHRPANTGRAVKLWLGFLVIIAAGIALAWIGAGTLRPEVTESGLQFRTVVSGSGEPIGPNDAALLDYIGTFPDGTVFDSSEQHGGPQAMSPSGMIPGFAEAMKMMREGGQYHFTLPPSLAYGANPPPGMPPNSSLTFDVRVRKVVRGGAAMMQGAARPQ
jgi:FKBP-type peptidyl-prolyl cis-trans isomerase FkpA